MNVKFYKRKDNSNSDFFNHINNTLRTIDFNNPGKIQEKLITINANKIPFPKENKIKELEITLKPRKINRIISPKIEPYLKPKCKLKNRNSFCIKNKNSKNKEKIEFKTNGTINDLNLNMLKLFNEENGKIIKDKNNNKENNNCLNNINNNEYSNTINNKTNRKIKNNNNNINESSYTKNSKTKNTKKIKYLYTDTPSQSTTTENKSDTKSRKTQTKNGTTNSKKQSSIKSKNEINEKTKLIKQNIYYDNLPLFLLKKKQYKKSNKTYKDIYNGNKKINSKGKINLLEKTITNNKKPRHKKDILIKKINFNILEKEKNSNDSSNKKKKFISHKNNLSLNMTNERENILKNLGKKNNDINNNNKNIKNNNIKKIYISTVKTRNITDTKNIKLNNLSNIDNNIFSFNHSSTNAQRNTFQFQDKFLFNFFRNKKKDIFRNNSFGNNYQNLTNNNSYNNISRESSFFDQHNLSFNNNLFKNKSFNFLNDINANILNKTKNILKITDNQKFCSNQNSQKYLILDNYETNFDRYPKRVIQQSHKNFREKIINIPNISYIINSNTMNKEHNKIFLDQKRNIKKKPCSLYFNKNNFATKEKECNFSLNDYYNNKNNNLTINNININQNNLGYNKHIYKNFPTFENKKVLEINNSMNKHGKLNINLKKYININQNNSSENINNNENNIFLFNRNKGNIVHSHNTSLNFIPSLVSLNRVNIE